MNFVIFRELCSQFEEITFDNAEDFCNKFCKCKDVELIHIRYSSGTVEFVYLTYSGQHVLDAIKWEEYQEWIKPKMPR